MKVIKLPQNKVVIVDDEDFDHLNQWKWNIHTTKWTSYAKRINYNSNGTKTIVYMHRQIMGVTDRSIVCDHIDHNGLNNQRSNLRVCSVSQNNSNRTIKKGKTTSRFLGVYFYKPRNKFVAKLTNNHKSNHLGYFTSEVEAALAYNKKAIETHGEFAKLNIIP